MILLVRRSGGDHEDRALSRGGNVGATRNGSGYRMEQRVWNPFSQCRVSNGIGTSYEQGVARRDDAFSDRRDLLGTLSRPENHFRKALSCPSLVIDAGEAEVFEGRLAQILKESVLRSLRCNGAAANVFEEGLELVARHAVRKRSSGSKCLRRVDFQFC